MAGFEAITRADPAINRPSRYDFDDEQLVKYRNENLAESLPYLKPGERTARAPPLWKQFDHLDEPAFLNLHRAKVHAYVESFRDRAESDVMSQPIDQKLDPLVKFRLLKDVNEVIAEAINFMRGGAGSTNSLITMARDFQTFIAYFMQYGTEYRRDQAFKLEFEGKLVQLQNGFTKIMQTINNENQQRQIRGLNPKFTGNLVELAQRMQQQLKELLDFGHVNDTSGFTAENVERDPTLEADEVERQLEREERDVRRAEKMNLLRRQLQELRRLRGEVEDQDRKDQEEEQKERKDSDSDDDDDDDDDDNDDNDGDDHDSGNDGDDDDSFQGFRQGDFGDEDDDEDDDEQPPTPTRGINPEEFEELGREMGIDPAQLRRMYDLSEEGLPTNTDTESTLSGVYQDPSDTREALDERMSGRHPSGLHHVYNSEVKDFLRSELNNRSLPGKLTENATFYRDYMNRRADNEDAHLLDEAVLKAAVDKGWLTGDEAQEISGKYDL